MIKRDENEGGFLWIDKHLLHVDHTYQQVPKPVQAKELGRNWDMKACATLLVTIRAEGPLKGQYVVLDGQQRLAGAMLREDVTLLPCRVVQTTGVKDEARLFLSVDIGRRQVSAFDKYKALLTAGDEEAWFVEDTLDSLSLRLTSKFEFISTQSAGEP